MLVNGVAAQSVALPNRGSATDWADLTVNTRVPLNGKVGLRLDTGDAVRIDYLTPGQIL